MSDTKEDGGPAVTQEIYTISNGIGARSSVEYASGMSVRDWFAGMALQGWLASYGSQATHPVVSHQQDDVASLSYKIADAMLKARKGG